MIGWRYSLAPPFEALDYVPAVRSFDFILDYLTHILLQELLYVCLEYIPNIYTCLDRELWFLVD